MSGIQTKIIGHAKKQENINHNQQKDQSIETDPELTEILELAEKGIKTVTIFYKFKSRDMRDKKDPNLTSREKRYNKRNEKHAR